jgi:hypothetical protein
MAGYKPFLQSRGAAIGWLPEKKFASESCIEDSKSLIALNSHNGAT